MKNKYTKESLEAYYEACADICKEFDKLQYAAKKNYDEVTKDLYSAKVKSIEQAEYLLVLKEVKDA